MKGWGQNREKRIQTNWGMRKIMVLTGHKYDGEGGEDQPTHKQLSS